MTQHEQPGNGPTDERKLRCAVLVKMGNFIVAKFGGREETTDRPGRRIKSPGGEGGWTRDICAEIADEGVISVF